MNLPAENTLPEMVRVAARTLSEAKTSAEVLEAKEKASMAYDAAKRMARAKAAHDDIKGRIYRVQGQALEIEARAKIRLADEYDAAQAAGEIKKHGRPKVSERETLNSTDVIPPREAHEARQLRDAENAEPGRVSTIINECLDAGKEPTRAAIKPKKPRRKPDHNKQFWAIVKAWEAAEDAVKERFLQHIGAEQ